MVQVVVLGAGVIGLQAAVYLLRAGHKVTIIAAHLPGDQSIEYTSPWAGAHWRTHALEDDTEQRRWDVETYQDWMRQLELEQSDGSLPKSGLRSYESYHYWDTEPAESLWWAPFVNNFHEIAAASSSIDSINETSSGPVIKAAAAFTSVAVNVPQYLLYLLSQAKNMGVTVLQCHVPYENGLTGAVGFIKTKLGSRQIDCIVNATGLGAAKFCNDKSMYPIRGQTVLVKGEAQAIRTRVGEDYIAYCIPRPGSGTTILGGTKDAGVWDEMVDDETTGRILERCKCIVPELLTGADGGFEVVSVQVGLRPARRGGARMEKEIVGGKRIVHAYGHSGAGYQNSIGAANKVVRLVNESVGAASRPHL